jgi:hypothetical protein
MFLEFNILFINYNIIKTELLHIRHLVKKHRKIYNSTEGTNVYEYLCMIVK